MTTGLNADTGAALSGSAHLQQSVADILTTPIGSRVMRRDYGSRLPDLIDKPATPANRLAALAAAADALRRWEPRLIITRLSLSADTTADAQAGRLRLTVEGFDRTDNQPASQPRPVRLVAPLQ